MYLEILLCEEVDNDRVYYLISKEVHVNPSLGLGFGFDFQDAFRAIGYPNFEFHQIEFVACHLFADRTDSVPDVNVIHI